MTASTADTPSTRSLVVANLGLLTMICFWGSYFPVMDRVLSGWDPLSATAGRQRGLLFDDPLESEIEIHAAPRGKRAKPRRGRKGQGAAAPVSSPSLNTKEGPQRFTRLFVTWVAVICRCSLCSWSCSEKRSLKGAGKYLSSSRER